MAGSVNDTFDYINTRQFFDFNKGIDEELDERYFELDHEANDPLYTSYNQDVTLIIGELDKVNLPDEGFFRRSMSSGDLQMIKENVHRLRSGKIYSNEDETITTNSTRSSRETINRLAKPKWHKSDQNISTSGFVSMAEAVRKFQNGTPKRFRSKPNLTSEVMKTTVAHTPKLQTAVRARPVSVLSTSVQEQLAVEEFKKNQFKANPINKNIFKSPVPQVKAKKNTVPEPFNLTEPVKKVSESPVKKNPEFHANPVPKHVYKQQQPLIKAPLKITNPQTPTFMKHHNAPIRASVNKNETVHQPTLKSTKILPFSFEMRDKHQNKKRQEILQKMLEAEKKAREFHARPVPKCVLEPSTSGFLKKLDKTNTTKSQETINTTCFKAKTPKVLYQKPFEPKKANRPLLEIDDFTLNTDLRSKRREEFERQLREKEEKVKQFREEEERNRKQQEAEQILIARKQAEFKAQEIKKYKEVKMIPSQKVTNPVSPKFLSNKHKNKSANKENIE